MLYSCHVLISQKKKTIKNKHGHAVHGTPSQIPTLSLLCREQWKIRFLSHTLTTWGSHVASLVKFHPVVWEEIVWRTDGQRSSQYPNYFLKSMGIIEFCCLLISSPRALLQVNLCRGLLSVVRSSLAFHIFDISRTISWIELKLSGRHCGNMEIQNCWNRSVPISKMAAKAAILKFFKRHLLPNHKWDWAETWWEASQWHIQNC